MHRERVKYIDYTKGLGILFIVFAHCIQYFKPMQKINGYICSFHVPIFFIIAGTLAYFRWEKDKFLGEFICRRAKRLLIPYVIFSTFNTVLKFSVLFIKGNLNQDEINKEMQAFLITGNGTVWFLVALFMVELLWMFIKNVSKGKRYNLIICIISICGLIVPYCIGEIRSCSFGIVLLRVIAGSGYYGVGILLSQYLETNVKINNMIFAIIMLGAGCVIYILFGSKLDFFNGIFLDAIPSIFCSICSSVGIIFLMYFFEQKDTLDRGMKYIFWGGQNSLLIMLIHPTILLLFTYPFGNIFSSFQGVVGILVSILLFSLIMLLNVLLIILYKRIVKYAKRVRKLTE